MPLKTILITGCGAGGIGSALAKAFHLRGHRVFATGRSAEETDPALGGGELGGITTFDLDVTSDSSIREAVETVARLTGGRLDMLVHNAGVLHVMPFADSPLEDVRRLMDVNVLSVWALTQAFLPLLLEATSSKDHGQATVVGIGSVNTVFCPPFLSAYNASKAALEALLRTLRRELAPLGVRVVLLKTGSVGSRLFEHAPGRALPRGSLYAPLQEWIGRRGFLGGARFMDVDVYAESVAPRLLGETVGAVVWEGGLVWVAWVLSWLGWETMMVSEAEAAAE